MLKKILMLTCAGMASALASSPALAEQDPKAGVITFLVENDAFARADRNYTNGLKLAYVAPRGSSDRIRDFLQTRVWPGGDKAIMRTQWSIGQSVFTPQDLSIAAPQPNDRPYAGWAYIGYGVIAERPNHVTTVDLELGITGESSGGEWAQKNLHKWLDNKEPQGWDNQLDDHFGANLTIERTWRNTTSRFLGMEAQIAPSLGVTLGSVITEAALGSTVRLGTNLETAPLPMRVRPSLAGSGSFDETDGIGWYVFAGASVRAVAYNAFLEGDLPYNTNIEKESFVMDAQLGAALRLGRLQLTYTYVGRSEEFEQQVGGDRFGALGFSWHF